MALDGLRDLSTLKWYVIPLLAIVFYIYATEIKKARQTGNWNAVYAGLTLFGVKSDCYKIITISGIYALAVAMNVVGSGIWVDLLKDAVTV
jgi:hypothetical protein